MFCCFLPGGKIILLLLVDMQTRLSALLFIRILCDIVLL